MHTIAYSTTVRLFCEMAKLRHSTVVYITLTTSSYRTVISDIAKKEKKNPQLLNLPVEKNKPIVLLLCLFMCHCQDVLCVLRRQIDILYEHNTADSPVSHLSRMSHCSWFQGSQTEHESLSLQHESPSDLWVHWSVPARRTQIYTLWMYIKTKGNLQVFISAWRLHCILYFC